jgi:hypothetical protein
MDAVTPISVVDWSRVGTPHAAYVSFVARSTSTTEQFAALQAAAALMKLVSAQRQPKSLDEQLDVDTVASTHFDWRTDQYWSIEEVTENIQSKEAVSLETLAGRERLA